MSDAKFSQNRFLLIFAWSDVSGNHPICPKTPPVGYMAKTSSNKGYSFISQPESFDYQLRTGSLISNAQGRNPSFSDYLVTPSSTSHVKLSGLLIESHHDHHLLPTHSTSRDISNNSVSIATYWQQFFRSVVSTTLETHMSWLHKPVRN